MIVLDTEHLIDSHSVDTAVIEAPSRYARSIQSRQSSGLAEEPGMRGFVATHPLLCALSECERLMLLQWSRVRHVSRYEMIHREGEPANSVLIVLHGHAKSSRATADGREVLLALAGPLDCAGAIAALRQRPYESDLTALTMCRVLAIDAKQFRKVFEREPEGLLALVRLVGDRLQHLAERLTDQQTLSVTGRLAKALLDLAGPSAPGCNGRLARHLSQQELGILTNSSRETVNKQLKVLLAAGGISMSDGKVTAIRSESLAGFVVSGAHQERQRKRASA